YDRRYDSGSHGGACCSEFLITYPLKWNGSDFEIFGKEKKVSRYPVEQIRFEKGAYGEEIHSMRENGEKRVQDAKRFVFRAKSGQVLTWTPIDPNVSFFIYDGDAEKLDPALPNDESVKHTQLKLNETGEYYFMVRKDENFGRDIAFSIDIR